MVRELIRQIQENEYNEMMLFSLYNTLEDEGCLIELSMNNNNEKYCVDDFEWLKLTCDNENIDILFNELNKHVKEKVNGSKNGLFLILKNKNIFSVKLKSFNF